MMNARVVPVWEILKVNSRLVRNALSGVSREEAESRPNARTNHIAFLAVHLLDARYYLLKLAGGKRENPFAERLEGAAGIDDIAEYPAPDLVLKDWERLDGELERRLTALTDSELDAAAPQTFPVDDATVCGALSFLAQHDAYHVGQLCYVRKYLGHDAVSYD